MKDGKFAHLHIHSEYSLVDGLVRIPRLVEKAKSLNQPAVAITDQSNLFCVVKFFRAALAVGVKPIIGAEIWLADDSPESKSRLVLLCKSLEGYRQLTRIVTRSYREGQVRGVPMVKRDWITASEVDELICLSGGREGEIGTAVQAGNIEQARQQCQQFQTLFGDRFYLEIVRTGRSGEQEYGDAAITLAHELSIPLVATNDVRFLEQEDFDAHEARVCINRGRVLSDPRRERPFTNEQYLKSTAEMATLFHDLPEALENSVNIAKRCNVVLDIGTYHMPKFPVTTAQNVDQLLREQTALGLQQRWEALCELDQTQGRQFPEYEARAQRELDVVIQMGFSGYFLIVADFIRWAKEHEIPVGPGRGSGAGSLVAYALGITDLDPLAYDLIFERFLNPERVSMPDFDIDFCMDRRDEVIDYVVQKYGRNQVAQIITHGTMAAKAVVRDVGRVLGQGDVQLAGNAVDQLDVLGRGEHVP